MNKFIIIIQALLNKLSVAYKEIFDLKDLCDSYKSHIDFLEKAEKLNKKQIADLERLVRASEYSNECYIKSIRNDIKEINNLKEENDRLKEQLKLSTNKWKFSYVCHGCTNEEVVTTNELIKKCFSAESHNNPYLEEVVIVPYFEKSNK